MQSWHKRIRVRCFELHSGDLPVRDEHLDVTRAIPDYPDGEGEWESQYRNVRRLVRHFGAGPLSPSAAQSLAPTSRDVSANSCI